jgi:hypothetical protein
MCSHVICHGAAHARMPEKFLTVGMGEGQAGAQEDARSAFNVLVGANSALSKEITRLGFRQICGQISVDLCEICKPSE